MKRVIVRVVIFISCAAGDVLTKLRAVRIGRYQVNAGASFSIGEGMPAVAALLSLLAVSIIAVFAVRAKRTMGVAGSVMMLAGAVCNGAERLLMGHVVDWICMWGLWWNVADVCLCIGGALLLADLLLGSVRDS